MRGHGSACEKQLCEKPAPLKIKDDYAQFQVCHIVTFLPAEVAAVVVVTIHQQQSQNLQCEILPCVRDFLMSGMWTTSE